MTPTQEQVIAWARRAIGGAALCWTVQDLMFRFGNFKDDKYQFKPDDLITFASFAHEAGRRDENEACAELIPPQYFELRDRIRARREQ